jgi:PAS domain S-box-containing protein
MRRLLPDVKDLERRIAELETENKSLSESVILLNQKIQQKNEELSAQNEELRKAREYAEITSNNWEKAQDTLKHSHDLMRYIIEHSRSAIAVHDRNLRYIYVSQRYLKEYNIKDPDIIGKHHYDVFPDLPEKWRSAHQKALKGEITSHENDIYVKADGSIEFARWECRPWHESDGSIGGFIIYTEVITDRIKMEEALRETNERLLKQKQKAELSEAQFRVLLENGPVPMYIQTDHKFTYINKALLNLYGAENADQIIDTSVTERIHPDYRDLINERINKTYTKMEPVTKTEYLHLRMDNEPIYVETSAVPIVYNNKNGALVFVNNITQRKQTEKRLVESEQTLKLFVEYSPAAMAMFDKDMHYLVASRRYIKDYCNYDENIIGKSHYEVFPYLPDTWKKIHQHCLKGNIESCEEDIFLTNDGLKRWIRWQIYPWYSHNEIVGGIILFLEDITDRKNAQQLLEKNVNARIQAELELKESYELLKNLADQVPGVIYQYKLCPDGSSGFPWSSSGMYDIFECTPDEVREDASKVFTHLHPEDAKMVSDAIFESSRYQTLFHVEFRVILPEQGLRWRSSYAKPELLSDGSTLWHGVITDITPRKQMEFELDIKNEELTTFFDCALDLLCIASIKGDFLRLNREWENVLGYPLEEIENRNFAEFIHPDDLQSAINIVSSIKDQEKAVSFTYRYRAKNGDYKWIEWKSYHKEDKVFAAARDITERIRIETELRESKEQLRFAFEGSNDGLWDVNIRDAIFFLSPRGCEILGYKPNEVNDVIRNWHNLVFEEDLQESKARLEAHLNGETEIFEVEQRLKMKSGELKWILTRGKLVSRDSEGKPLRITGTHTDITDRKKAENVIKKLNENLESRIQIRTQELLNANKELEAFSYSVSHDLRSPLRAVIGYTNILLEDYGNILDEEGKRVCSVISSNAVKMGKLIDDLLAFSRLSRNEMQYTVFEMKELATSVFTELQAQNKNKKIEFKIDNLPRADGDYSMIRQVWFNLISNAIKYTSRCDKPKISVGFTENPNETVYYIRDNGIGFDMQYINKLFGVFQRLHNTRDFEGTGVGLAIVQRIINRHGGHVWAEGKLESGATFYISLPKTLISEDHHDGTI